MHRPSVNSGAEPSCKTNHDRGLRFCAILRRRSCGANIYARLFLRTAISPATPKKPASRTLACLAVARARTDTPNLRFASERLEAEGRAEAVLDIGTVARRKRSRRLAGLDEDLHERGPAPCRRALRDFGTPLCTRNRERFCDAKAFRDCNEIGAQTRVAWLHAGFAEMTIVEDHDRQIARLLGGDRRK